MAAGWCTNTVTPPRRRVAAVVMRMARVSVGNALVLSYETVHPPHNNGPLAALRAITVRAPPGRNCPY